MNELDEDVLEYVLDIARRLEKVLIVETSKDQYLLFNKYVLYKDKDVAIVERETDGNKFSFMSFRNATVWCILDFNNKIYQANRVLELDNRIASVYVERSIHTKYIKSKKTLNREIIRDKLWHDDRKLSLFRAELDKYIIAASTYQQKGYENELKRIHGK